MAMNGASTAAATGERRPPCQTWQSYQFCSYGLDCQYAHGPLPSVSIVDLVQELIQMALAHTKGSYVCALCNYNGSMDTYVAKVGETESYKYCPRCGNFFYYPHVQFIVLKVLEKVGTDYQEFKHLVDSYYRRLPAIVQPAFMYEAHRWATRSFAWSLTGPKNVKELLTAMFKYNDFKRLFSMGSGTGYVEHVFLNVSKEMKKPLEVRAFDSMKPKPDDRRIHFDVTVEQGDVDSLKTFGGMKESLLLLCWPPFGSQNREESTMAFDCIQQFAAQGGEYLVYIGDVNATGDWRYHDHLASHWELLDETFSLTKLEVWVPQQMGLIYAGNDSIGLYRKRETPKELPPRIWHVTA